MNIALYVLGVLGTIVGVESEGVPHPDRNGLLYFISGTSKVMPKGLIGSDNCKKMSHVGLFLCVCFKKKRKDRKKTKDFA